METKDMIIYLSVLANECAEATELDDIGTISIDLSDVGILDLIRERLEELSTYEGRQNVHAA